MRTPTAIMLALALALISAITCGSAVAADRTLQTTVTLQNGKADIRLPNVRQTYRLVSSGKSLACYAVRPSGLAKLRSVPPTSSSNDLGCPCGVVCWEDEDEQASICVCKSCGGGGPLPVLLVIADHQDF